MRRPDGPLDGEIGGGPAFRSLVDREEREGGEPRYLLRLYVAGSNQRSLRAVERARRFCDEHLTDDYHLEVVDIYESPRRAVDAQIVAAPTLVRERPGPSRQVIGDLSDEADLLSALGPIRGE